MYLKSGDLVAVSVNGLGTLTNRIASLNSSNPTTERFRKVTALRTSNMKSMVMSELLLTTINNKPMNYFAIGKSTNPPIVFVHGYGGSSEIFQPIYVALGLPQSHWLHLFDIEGHGQSPTSSLSKISIRSIAQDINGILEHRNITSGATIIAHSSGCLAAIEFALSHPDKVSQLILLGPPPTPVSEDLRKTMHTMAERARFAGMTAIVDRIARLETSTTTTHSNPLAFTAIRASLLGQDPEGFAKSFTAYVDAERLDVANLRTSTLIITGSDDSVSGPQVCQRYYMQNMGGRATLRVLEGIGHWSVFEDVTAVASAIGEVL